MQLNLMKTEITMPCKTMSSLQICFVYGYLPHDGEICMYIYPFRQLTYGGGGGGVRMDMVWPT